MKGPPQMKRPPSRRGALPRRQVRKSDKKRKSPSKTKPRSFDALVARYYSSIYTLVLQITDDPLEALLLTQDAFNRTRKQLRSRRDETMIVGMLVAAVSEGLNARGLN